MTLRPLTWIEIGAASLVVIVGGIWLHEHDARIREQAVAQAVQDTQKQIRAEDDKKFSELAKQIADRDAARNSQLADMAKTVTLLKTPQQQVVWSQDQLKDALRGITITLDSKGQAVATIPAASIPALPQAIEQCKECGVKLDAATATLADRKTQAELAQKQIDSLKVENKALVVASKGGTVWHRTLKAMKYIVLGAAGGVVAICASGHCR